MGILNNQEIEGVLTGTDISNALLLFPKRLLQFQILNFIIQFAYTFSSSVLHKMFNP